MRLAYHAKRRNEFPQLDPCNRAAAITLNILIEGAPAGMRREPAFDQRSKATFSMKDERSSVLNGLPGEMTE